jgi:hypothetical protein
MAQAGFAAVVKRGANENGLTDPMNMIVGPFGKERPVDSDNRCAKVPWNLHRPAFPRCSGARKMEPIAVEKRDRGCRTYGRKSDIHA